MNGRGYFARMGPSSFLPHSICESVREKRGREDKVLPFFEKAAFAAMCHKVQPLNNRWRSIRQERERKGFVCTRVSNARYVSLSPLSNFDPLPAPSFKTGGVKEVIYVGGSVGAGIDIGGEDGKKGWKKKNGKGGDKSSTE